MTTSYQHTTKHTMRTSHAAEHALRAELVARGIPAWKVAATPRALLNRLDQESPQLRLVPDAEAHARFDAAVLDLAPRLAWRALPVDDETPDEHASTLTFLRDEAHRRGGLPVPPHAVEPVGIASAATSTWGGDCA